VTQNSAFTRAYAEYLLQHDLLLGQMVRNVRLPDREAESLRQAYESEKAIIATLLDSADTDSPYHLQQRERRDEKQKLLRRDRKIGVLRLLQRWVEQLMGKIRGLVKAPDIPLPSRFPGDLHALRDEREYFAVAVELYFYDPERFRMCYTVDEQRALEGLLDRGLKAVGVGDKK